MKADKRNEFREYYKRHPIEFYESYLGVKLTKMQKFNLRIKGFILDYLELLLKEEDELLIEIILEPCGTLRHEALKLHSAILEFKISVVKSILRME